MISLAGLVAADAPKLSLAVDPRALSVVDSFEAKWKATRTASYRLIKRERLRSGKVVVEELAVKLRRPGAVYLHMHSPHRGREVIYDARRDRARLTVHPGHFPDLTLRLNIQGALATIDQHHTIDDMGFDQVQTVLRWVRAAAEQKPMGERLEYAGEGEFDGRVVDKVVFVAGQRRARSEVARDNESVFAFADRVRADAYVIFCANPQIDDLDDVLEAGRAYRVPAYYARRIESWFDRETGLPLVQSMWDDEGELYERYEHYGMRVNVPFTDADFDPDNPAYGF
jgi:outer membrane lipoprotein-sorting protein